MSVAKQPPLIFRSGTCDHKFRVEQRTTCIGDVIAAVVRDGMQFDVPAEVQLFSIVTQDVYILIGSGNKKYRVYTTYAFSQTACWSPAGMHAICMLITCRNACNLHVDHCMHVDCNCNCNCNVEFVKRAKILLTVKTVTKALVRMFSDYLAIQICFQFWAEFTIRHRRSFIRMHASCMLIIYMDACKLHVDHLYRCMQSACWSFIRMDASCMLIIYTDGCKLHVDHLYGCMQATFWSFIRMHASCMLIICNSIQNNNLEIAVDRK